MRVWGGKWLNYFSYWQESMIPGSINSLECDWVSNMQLRGTLHMKSTDSTNAGYAVLYASELYPVATGE